MQFSFTSAFILVTVMTLSPFIASADSNGESAPVWLSVLEDMHAEIAHPHFFDVLLKSKSILSSHKSEAQMGSTQYGSLYQEYTRTLHSLNARKKVTHLEDEILRDGILRGLSSLSRPLREFEEKATVDAYAFLDEKIPLEKVVESLTRVALIDRPRSLQNLWPGMEDVLRYQTGSSIRARQIWQVRKDFVSHVTLRAISKSLRRILSSYAFLGASLGEVKVDPERWGDEWLKSAYPSLFHQDRLAVLRMILPTVSSEKSSPASSLWISVAKSLCTKLPRAGYSFQLPDFPAVTSEATVSAPYNAYQNWKESQKRSIESVEASDEFGFLLSTDSLTHKEGKRPLTLLLDCKHPESETNHELLRRALSEFSENVKSFWREVDTKGFDSDDLSTEGICDGLRYLLTISPEAVGEELQYFSSHARWVTQVGNDVFREREKQKDLENKLFVTATLASIFIPVAGEALAAGFAVQSSLRIGLFVISMGKAGYEFKRSIEWSDLASVEKKLSLITQDASHFSGSEKDLKESRDLLISAIFDAGFSLFQAQKVFTDAAKLCGALKVRRLSELNSRAAILFQESLLFNNGFSSKESVFVNAVTALGKRLSRQGVKEVGKFQAKKMFFSRESY